MNVFSLRAAVIAGLMFGTAAYAQTKDQLTQQLIDLQTQIETLKAQGNLSAIAPVQVQFDQISAQLGGDTPCGVGPVQAGSSASRAPAPSPVGCTATTTNFAQTTATAIPTGPAVVTSTLTVAGAGSYLWDVDITTNIVHSFAADLDITIQSPAGTVVTLTTDNGAGNDNVFNGTVWDDDANPGGTVPYTTNNGLVTDHAYANLTLASPLVPEESLAAFVGENPNGTWTITISDDLAGDGGSLDSWALALTTFPQAVQTSPLQAFNQTTPVAIPTGPAVVTSTLAVSGVTNRLCKAVIRSSITHSFSADMDITLTSPAGTVVTLTTDNGAGNDNTYNGTTWDDDANAAGQVPYVTNNGLATDHAYVNLTTATPLVVEESMGAFMGEDANGTWTLTISDDLAGDGGSIDAWGLDIQGCFCGGDLTLAVTDTPDPVTPGTAITYVATATNNGPGSVSEVNISFPMAAGTTFTSAAASAGGSCTSPAVGATGTVSCTWPGVTAVGAGAARSVTIVAGVPPAATPGTNLTVNATTASTPPDLNTGNNGASATTTVGPASADLLAGLTAAPTPSVVAGTNLVYSATVTNQGPSDAQNAQVSLPLPAGTSLVSAMGTGATCSGTTTVVCVFSGATAPTIARTAMITVLVAASVPNGSTLSAINSVSATTADPVTGNNDASVSTSVVANADLSAGLTAAPTPSVIAGTNLVYTATVANLGPSDAQNAQVSLGLPAGTSLVSASGTGATCSGTTTVVCVFNGATAPTITRTATITALVAPSVANGATLSASNTVSSATTDPAGGNNTASVSTTVNTSADLVAGLTAAPSPSVSAGANLVYTATVAKLGPSDAQNVQVSLPLPAGTSLVSASGTGATCSGTTTVVCVFNGATAPSVTRTATITVLVGAAVANGTTLTATNTVSSATSDPATGNNTASVSTTVVTSANLALTLTASSLDTPLNTPVTFTAVSTNLGPSDAQNLSISIVLSPDFRFGTVTPGAGGTCTSPQIGLTGTVTCTYARATAANTSRTMAVTSAAVVDGVTTISASTTSATSDPVTTNNTASLSMRAGLPYEAIPVNNPVALALLALLLGGLGLTLVRRYG